MAYDVNRNLSPQTSGELFPARQLVPKRWLPKDRRCSFIVEPLFFEEQQFGFALFEMGSTDGIVYEMLRDQISAAMKGEALVREVFDKDAERKELLSYIIDVTPDMHRIQPLADLLQDILKHAMGLASADDALLATPPEGEEGHLNLLTRSVAGKFEGVGERIEACLDPEEVEMITDALKQGTILLTEARMVIPLRIRELSVGVVYLLNPTVSVEETELLRIFSNQATVAIQNTKLYEMAALDPLTGVHTRRFFEQWMQKELRAVFRAKQPMCMLMLDVDGLKKINDNLGHLAGDKALALVGKVVRRVIRDTDVVGRYGGDEFSVLLPHTSARGATLVGQRILDLLDKQVVETDEGDIPIRSSVGLSMLRPHSFSGSDLPQMVPPSYFLSMATDLIRKADAALYEAKRSGGQQVKKGEPTDWRRVDDITDDSDTL